MGNSQTFDDLKKNKYTETNSFEVHVISKDILNKIKNKKTTIFVDSFDINHVMSKLNEHNNSPYIDEYSKIPLDFFTKMLMKFNSPDTDRDIIKNTDCLCNCYFRGNIRLSDYFRLDTKCIVKTDKNINGLSEYIGAYYIDGDR